MRGEEKSRWLWKIGPGSKIQTIEEGERTKQGVTVKGRDGKPGGRTKKKKERLWCSDRIWRYSRRRELGGANLSFLLGGSPSYRKITFFSFRFDIFVCWAVLILMQQIGKQQRRFLVKQKANLRRKQFGLRLFQLLGKMSCKISCLYNSLTHSNTHTRVYKYAKRHQWCRGIHTCTRRTCSFI